MLDDDALEQLGCHASVPDSFRIHHEDRTAGADAARRNEARKDNEVETRERAAKFRAALGKQQAEGASEDRTQVASDRAKQAARQEIAQGRADERGRDRAAAADVLGRLGLSDGPEANATAGAPKNRPALSW